MRKHSSSFFGLPWKRTIIILTLLTVFPLYAVAVEPTIQASGYVSWLLRNDGVLFQLGGQSFTPVTLPPTAIPPIQPKVAILTNVDSLPILKDQHGN